MRTFEPNAVYSNEWNPPPRVSRHSHITTMSLSVWRWISVSHCILNCLLFLSLWCGGSCFCPPTDYLKSLATDFFPLRPGSCSCGRFERRQIFVFTRWIDTIGANIVTVVIISQSLLMGILMPDVIRGHHGNSLLHLIDFIFFNAERSSWHTGLGFGTTMCCLWRAQPDGNNIEFWTGVVQTLSVGVLAETIIN